MKANSQGANGSQYSAFQYHCGALEKNMHVHFWYYGPDDSTLNPTTNCFAKDKEKHFIKINGLIYQRNITIINVCESNTEFQNT